MRPGAARPMSARGEADVLGGVFPRNDVAVSTEVRSPMFERKALAVLLGIGATIPVVAAVAAVARVEPSATAVAWGAGALLAAAALFVSWRMRVRFPSSL